MHGKGLIDEQGNVHTWTNDWRDGYPSHPQYASDALGMGERDFTNSPIWDRAFQIAPKGDVRLYGPDIPDEPLDPGYNRQALMKTIQKADPRLLVDETGPWNFTSMRKQADKLHDFLMNPKSRPDLQTPEGQAWLNHLNELQNHVGPKMDPLTPWLTREWKKGRMLDAGRGAITHYIHPQHATAYNEPFERRQELSDESPATISNQRDLSHWADFMQSKHPLRREMGDIMQHKVQDFHDRINQWDQAMEGERKDQAAKGGKVVHQWPDGWSVRQLTTPEELEGEGDAMGHCVGSYADQVANGRTMIYSLRDHAGHPHVTTEISPDRYESPPFDLERAFEMHPTMRHAPEGVRNMIREYANKATDKGLGNQVPKMEGWNDDVGPGGLYNIDKLFNQLYSHHQNETRKPIPHGGEVYQIQGAANRDPKPEYKQRMREWFERFPNEDRPTMEGDGDYWITDPRDVDERDHAIEGTPNEYGLNSNPRKVDWESMLDRSVDPDRYGRGNGYNYMDEIYDLAKARKEMPQLGKAFEPYREGQYEDFDKLCEQNWDWLDESTGPNPELQEEPYEEYSGYGEVAPWHEKTPEEQQEAMKEYEARQTEAENELMDQHGGMRAVKDLREKLAPHHVEWKKPDGTPIASEYLNEPLISPGEPHPENPNIGWRQNAPQL